MFLFPGMPSAIQSAIMQPLQANLDNILLSTSKLVVCTTTYNKY
jgi:hypothetical protein